MGEIKCFNNLTDFAQIFHPFSVHASLAALVCPLYQMALPTLASVDRPIYRMALATLTTVELYHHIVW
jgi:hypothetical protein